MNDNFYTQPNCDRCHKALTEGRTMSWFTEETICMGCSKQEQEIKSQLRARGKSNAMEGCGYVPDPQKVSQL